MIKFTEWYKERQLREDFTGKAQEVEFVKQGPDPNGGWSMYWRLPGTKKAGMTTAIQSAIGINPTSITNPLLQQQVAAGGVPMQVSTDSGSVYLTVMPKEAVRVMRQQTQQPTQNEKGMGDVLVRGMNKSAGYATPGGPQSPRLPNTQGPLSTGS